MQIEGPSFGQVNLKPGSWDSVQLGLIILSAKRSKKDRTIAVA